jgi:hypothetical protein
VDDYIFLNSPEYFEQLLPLCGRLHTMRVLMRWLCGVYNMYRHRFFSQCMLERANACFRYAFVGILARKHCFTHEVMRMILSRLEPKL